MTGWTEGLESRTRNIPGILSLILAGVVAGCSGTWNGPPVPVRHIPEARYVASDPGTLSLNRLWTYKHRAYLGAAPVAIGSFIVVVDHKGRVVFLDPNSGERSAEVKMKGAIESSPVWDSDQFYAVSPFPRKRLQAFAFGSGKQLWRRNFRHAPEPPILVGEEVWLPVADSVFALDRTRGKISRAILAGGDLWLTPTQSGSAIVIVGRSGRVLGLNRQGETQWDVELGSPCDFPAAIAEGEIYVTTSTGRIVKLDSVGHMIWEQKLSEQSLFAPIVDEQMLFVTGTSGHVWSLHRASGQEAWHAQLGSPAAGKALAHAQWVATTTVDGTLHLLDRTGGTILDRVSHESIMHQPPVWSFGRIFVVDSDKRIYAYGTRP